MFNFMTFCEFTWITGLAKITTVVISESTISTLDISCISFNTNCKSHYSVWIFTNLDRTNLLNFSLIIISFFIIIIISGIFVSNKICHPITTRGWGWFLIRDLTACFCSESLSLRLNYRSLKRNFTVSDKCIYNAIIFLFYKTAKSEAIL